MSIVTDFALKKQSPLNETTSGSQTISSMLIHRKLNTNMNDVKKNKPTLIERYPIIIQLDEKRMNHNSGSLVP